MASKPRDIETWVLCNDDRCQTCQALAFSARHDWRRTWPHWLSYDLILTVAVIAAALYWVLGAPR